METLRHQFDLALPFDEFRVWAQRMRPLLTAADIEPPCLAVLEYVCTEMLNNVLDHSGATFTFHDSCNVARASRMGKMPGGQFVIPREIIKSVANRFHDMAPGTTHDATFCCGGGGGLLTDDLMELRVKGALPRMESLKHVVDEHGVNFMATICAICKAQFSKVLPYYGFDMSMVGGVHQLVSKAIRLGEQR